MDYNIKVCIFLLSLQLMTIEAMDSFPEMIGKIWQSGSPQFSQDLQDMLQDVDDLSPLNGVNQWKANYMLDAAKAGQSDSLCFDHSIYLLKGLQSFDAKSLAFFDSYGKLPSGLLDGAISWPGAFSQCRNISVTVGNRTDANGTFNGQYCYATIVKLSAKPSVLLNLGTCLPDSCSQNESLTFLRSWLYTLSQGKLYLYTLNCKPSSKGPLDTVAIIVVSIFSILGAIIAIATMYDYLIQYRERQCLEASLNSSECLHGDTDSNHGDGQSQPGMVRPSSTLRASEYTPLLGSTAAGLPTTSAVNPTPGKSVCCRLLLSFSALTNGTKLLSVSGGSSSGQNLSAVHGIRFFSMSWVILGHTLGFLASTSTKNPVTLYTRYLQSYAFQAILNATVSVDTFFLLSGLLATYLMLNKLRSNGGIRINWGLVYFHRFWRLTPPYMLVIAFYVGLNHYLGSGPLSAEQRDKNCANNWWQNLLYVNNFFPSTEACIDWTWYLANDMQFFIITPMIVIALYKFAVVGILLIVTLILVNFIIVGVLTKQNNYPFDIGDLSRGGVGNNGQNPWFDEVYVRPYCRVGPYAVGMLTAYVLYRTGLRPKINKVVVLVGWLVAFVCCYEVIYGTYSVSLGKVVLSDSVDAFYAAVHRVVWALGVAWVIYACVTGYGGPVNTLLSWPALVPLSRLTYMAYLVHPIVMFYVYTTQEQFVYLDNISIVYFFIGNLAISYGIAFITSLALEAPMMALEKVVLKKFM